MAKRRKNKARKARDTTRDFEQLEKNVRRLHPDVDTQIFTENKLSERIMDLAQAYFCEGTFEDPEPGMLMMTIVAWNAALIPEDERPELFGELLNDFEPKPNLVDRHLLMEDLRKLVELRLALWPDDRRYVINFDIQGAGDSLHLMVASVLYDT